MVKSPIDYKRKCAGCGRFFPKSDLYRAFGSVKCRDCLSVQTVTKHGVIIVPSFIRKVLGVDKGGRVRWVEKPGGLVVVERVEGFDEVNDFNQGLSEDGIED